MNAETICSGLEMPLLAGLSAEEAVGIQRAATVRIFAAGQSLFHEGDAPDLLPLIIEGQVRVWRCSRNGAAMTAHVLSRGDLPGCVAVFRHLPFPATATALTTVKALIWPAAMLHGMILRHPVIATNALGILALRTEELMQRLQEISTESVELRVIRTILRLADGTRTTPVTGPTDPVELPLRRQDIAEIAGTTMHSVSRLVSRWSRDGIVHAGRGRIMLLDRARLIDLLDRSP